MLNRFKNLNEVDLTKVQSLETKLGFCIVALEKQPALADISDEELTELRSLEEGMDAVLLAYKCQSER